MRQRMGSMAIVFWVFLVAPTVGFLAGHGMVFLAARIWPSLSETEALGILLYSALLGPAGALIGIWQGRTADEQAVGALVGAALASPGVLVGFAVMVGG